MKGLYKTISKGCALTALAAAGIFLFTGPQAFASKGDLMPVESIKKADAPLMITFGKAEVVTLPENVSDILVANPAIVDVQAIQSNKLYMVGMKIGDTNIIVLDAAGDVVKRIDVHVAYDLQAIQSKVDTLFPEESVKINAVHDQIFLTGNVSTPERASKIANLVGHYVSDLQDEKATTDELISNLLEVRGEQQVMLQVKVLEAERSVIKEFGLDTRLNDPDELSVTSIFGETPPSSTTGSINGVGLGPGDGFTLSQDAIGLGSLFLDSGINGIGQIGLFLQALEEENLINVLAEPNLTAVSGQEAGFLAGGEFPVPTGRDQFGNITIEFREFGVSLNFRPVVLSDKRINLQLKTEVSSLDDTNSVVLSDLVVPGLDIRRADTTIEMPSGGSLMIAGLLQSETAKGMSGLPGIRKTPILGDLISSDGFRRNETELVVIVTAYLVEPFADKGNADKVPEKKEAALSKVFATNIRKAFTVKDESVFSSGGFGYILD